MSESKGERIGMTLASIAFTYAVTGDAAYAVMKLPEGKKRVKLEPTLHPERDLLFEGIQACYEQDASARALFSVPMARIAALEAKGYLVELGYLLARAEDAEGFDAMRLTLDEKTGELKAGTGVTAKAVYRRGEKLSPPIEYEEGKYAFAASLPELDPKNKDEKELNCRYRASAYLAVCEKDGSAMTVLYRDAVSFVSGDTFSVMDASEYFLYAGYGASETFTQLFGEVAAETARALYESYAECELLCTESHYRAKAIEPAHDGAVTEKAALVALLPSITDGMSRENALAIGADAANARARALLCARTGTQAYARAYADASKANGDARVLAESAQAYAMRAGASREASLAIRDASSRRLLAMSEETLAYLARLSQKNTEMQAFLDGDASYTANETVAAAFRFGVKSVTLDGTPLGQYLIVVGDKTETAGVLLQRLLIANTGISLGIYNHESGVLGEYFDYASEKAITVGLTSANLPKQGRGYAVYSVRRFLCIEGSDAEALAAGVAVFAKQLCGKETEGGTLALSLSLDAGAVREGYEGPLSNNPLDAPSKP